MTAAIEIAPPSPASRNRFVWPSLVVLLLGGHALLVTTALLLSSALIPAASVAPAGYAEAIAWDEQQARRRESERLGWSIEVAPSEATDVFGQRDIAFVLRDSRDTPLEGAELRVTMYHHSRPGETIRVIVPATEQAGVYAARMRVRREGLWRLAATAEREAQKFFFETDFWLSGGSP